MTLLTELEDKGWREVENGTFGRWAAERFFAMPGASSSVLRVEADSSYHLNEAVKLRQAQLGQAADGPVQDVIGNDGQPSTTAQFAGSQIAGNATPVAEGDADTINSTPVKAEDIDNGDAPEQTQEPVSEVEAPAPDPEPLTPVENADGDLKPAWLVAGYNSLEEFLAAQAPAPLDQVASDEDTAPDAPPAVADVQVGATVTEPEVVAESPITAPDDAPIETVDEAKAPAVVETETAAAALEPVEVATATDVPIPVSNVTPDVYTPDKGVDGQSEAPAAPAEAASQE